MSPIPEVGEHNEKPLAELGNRETPGLGTYGGSSRSLGSQSKEPSKRLPPNCAGLYGILPLGTELIKA